MPWRARCVTCAGCVSTPPAERRPRANDSRPCWPEREVRDERPRAPGRSRGCGAAAAAAPARPGERDARSMIASLRGTLLERGEGCCVIETAGVGYLVQVSTATLVTLPAPGEEVRLHTRHIVR